MSAWQHVNIVLGDGLLPDGTMPLPEPVMTHNQWNFVALTWGEYHKKFQFKRRFENYSFKITAKSQKVHWLN